MGVDVHVIDDGGPAPASAVAAGMINPLAGRRFALYPETELYLEAAEATYRELASKLGRQFYFPLPIHRYFQDAKEAERYQLRRDDPEFAPYLGDELPATPSCPNGGFVTLRSGRLNVPDLLSGIREWLLSEGRFTLRPLDYSRMKLRPEGVTWDIFEAEHVVFCEGWRVIHNPWFGQLPWDPVKGEILRLKFAELADNRILNSGKWLVPDGEGRFRAGATYTRDAFDAEATAEGHENILEGITRLVDAPPSKLSEYVAGVRPGTRTQHPLMGIHPQMPAISLFNGFGSKGSLLIPRLVSTFYSHLTAGQPLTATMDLRAKWTT